MLSSALDDWPAIPRIDALLKKDGYGTITITDEQAVVFDADKQVIAP